MKKFFSILLINIILLAGTLFILEYLIWACENARIIICKEKNNVNKLIPFHPKPSRFFFSLSGFPDKENLWGRSPSGLKYEKKPIVLFGCSFAYGFLLNGDETFSYRLSELTKRPVYNRAASGWGIQHMLYQVRQTRFYEIVPEPEYVIFLHIGDHFRRLYVPTFMATQMLARTDNLRYEYKDGMLSMKDSPSQPKDFFRRTYLWQKLEHVYINNIVLSEKNYENYSKFALEHFIESKAEMEKHWKNVKYIVLFYQHFYNDEDFAEQLEKAGFTVVSLPELHGLDIYSDKYMQCNYHPTAKAWEDMTPIIVNKLDLN